MNTLDDRTLLARWQELRDGNAFAEVARRYARVVFDVTQRVLGDPGMAEDVLQEAFLDLALESTSKPCEIGVPAWLVRFAVSRARNRKSSERRRAARQTAYARNQASSALPSDAVELDDTLRRAIGACNSEERALLALRFLHGWDYAQIASALSIQEGAARVRLHRLLLRVRSQLAVDSLGENEPTMKRALGTLRIIAIEPTWLDAMIAAVVVTAGRRAQPDGRARRSAPGRSIRIRLLCAGALLLVAATIAVPSRTASGGPEPVLTTPHDAGPRDPAIPFVDGLDASAIALGSTGSECPQVAQRSENPCAIASHRLSR